jgi:hypothetical protein
VSTKGPQILATLEGILIPGHEPWRWIGAHRSMRSHRLLPRHLVPQEGAELPPTKERGRAGGLSQWAAGCVDSAQVLVVALQDAALPGRQRSGWWHVAAGEVVLRIGHLKNAAAPFLEPMGCADEVHDRKHEMERLVDSGEHPVVDLVDAGIPGKELFELCELP